MGYSCYLSQPATKFNLKSLEIQEAPHKSIYYPVNHPIVVTLRKVRFIMDNYCSF